MPCKHCVIVRARLGELPFTLTLRVVPTYLRVILGYPFLRFFDPEIYWRDRVMRITKGERVFNVPVDTSTPHHELVPPVYADPTPNEAHAIISALTETHPGVETATPTLS